MSLRKERAAKGLCPNCGAEAAPYYLCGTCRLSRKMTAILKAGVRDGMVEAMPPTAGDRRQRYRMSPAAMELSRSEVDARWRYREADLRDRRNLPRLRGVPVEIESGLAELFREAGRPLTAEEVMAAWVKLRPRTGRPATHAMAAMIRAEDKRTRRMERNRKLVGVPEPEPPRD